MKEKTWIFRGFAYLESVMKFTSEYITELSDNQIFVFGSNEAGRHGAGAAYTAMRKFGAEYGEGNGPTGRCYAIPTKDYDIQTLPLDKIKEYVNEFLECAKNHSHFEFLVTPIGCGLAGYKPDDIAPFFKDAPPNVILPESFWKILNKE